MTATFYNRAKMTVSGTPGTGAITLGSAVSGFQTFAAAGVLNAAVVSYVIEDGTSWEVGHGTYTSSGTSLARTTVLKTSAGGTTPLTLTSAAVVYISALAEDLTTLGGGATGSGGGTAGYGAHAYWRFYCTDAQTSGQRVGFATLELRTQPNGAQRAVGGTASSPDASFGTTVPANAFDTDTATLWQTSAVAASGTPGRLDYHFAAAVEIVEISITTYNDTTYGFPCGPSTFKMQYSDDGTTWTDAWGYTRQTIGSSGGALQTAVFTSPTFVAGTTFRMADISDVEVLSSHAPQDGQFLSWSGMDGKFKPVNPPAGISAGDAIDVSGAASQSISSGSFTRVAMTTVNRDPGGHWDNTNHWYTCPKTGLYLITGSLRVADSTADNTQYGVGVYTSEADGAWFFWHAVAGAMRSTYPYSRISYQSAGDQLRMFTFVGSSLNLLLAGMQIVPLI